MKTKMLMKKDKNSNKVKVSEVDIESFPLIELKIDDYWKSLYEGSDLKTGKRVHYKRAK